jgi:prepilin-type N-terminal cleavage/methylation domain-containing protein/prepilin-type processing-associated H-X9-DG protein
VPRGGLAGRGGFTLLEVLVVIAILVLLLGIMLPALRSARQSVQAFRCTTNLREVVFAFRLFADDYGKGYRGESDQRSDGRFTIEDFQESIYRIQEFWDAPGLSVAPLQPSRELLMCPSGPRGLRKHANLPCSSGAVQPAAAISVAFNMRLHRTSRLLSGQFFAVPTALSEQVLMHGQVPLVLDVDGSVGASRPPPAPYYAAPPLAEPDFYSTGTYWFPARRHRGRINVGFVGGHVLSSPHPLGDPDWDWAYSPPP